MIVIFIPTSIMIAISYSWIWVISKQQRRHLESVMTDEAILVSRKNRKALRTLIIIIGAFYLAWAPFVFEHISKSILGKSIQTPEWLEIVIYIIAATNSFWNPIIYIGTNKIIRRATLGLLYKVLPCCTVLHGNEVSDRDHA